MMVTMGVFAGATMAGYASNIQTMYDTIYEDTNLRRPLVRQPHIHMDC